MLVILGHACSYWTGSWFTGNPKIESRGLEIFSIWVGSIHIFAFALVSGYLFAYKIIGGGVPGLF